MRRSNMLRATISATILLIASSSPVAAASPPLIRTLHYSRSGDLVFVMIPPESGPHRFPRDDRYPINGLYRTSGDTAPLWSVEAYHDGAYFVIDSARVIGVVDDLNPFASRRIALSLLEAGRAPRAITIDDLTDHVSSGRNWLHSYRFDDADATLELVTTDWNLFMIDGTAGIVSEVRGARFIEIIGVLAVIVLVVLAWYRRGAETGSMGLGVVGAALALVATGASVEIFALRSAMTPAIAGATLIGAWFAMFGPRARLSGATLAMLSAVATAALAHWLVVIHAEEYFVDLAAVETWRSHGTPRAWWTVVLPSAAAAPAIFAGVSQHRSRRATNPASESEG